MSTSINHAPSFGNAVIIPMNAGKTSKASNVLRSSLAGPKKDVVKLLSSGQDVAISSYKRRLKELEKQLKECKRENFETAEEFQKEYDYLSSKYAEIQEQMKVADGQYTVVNTDSRNKTISAVGNFFKDICSGLKEVGNEIINSFLGFFGAKKIA